MHSPHGTSSLWSDEIWYFSKAHLYGIDTDGYALFQMAKAIATRKKSIEINKIADEQLIGNTAFKAIVNATLIAKYGG